MLTLRSIFVLDFYPRPPRGGRQVCDKINQNPERFLSTPSARRATSHNLPARVSWTISIHALREEGDSTSRRRKPERRHFYPRPPRGGRRGDGLRTGKPCHFYPRPPRGGRHTPGAHGKSAPGISIHALREEGDRFAKIARATLDISIHALREEGDASASARSAWPMNFYPRPPRGGRQGPRAGAHVDKDFYPRPPRGGRLRARSLAARDRAISIHALREEGDRRAESLNNNYFLFLSTPSARRATSR